LGLAITAAKNGKDVELYEQIVGLLAQIDPQDPQATPDKAWVARTSAEVKAESSRLEAELKGYKNNLIKESIRVGG
jgi:COP9 signalosome complex subunit 1